MQLVLYLNGLFCVATVMDLDELHDGINKCVKKNQTDAQLILSIFRQPLHVSGLSRPIIRKYNRMYTTFGIVPTRKRTTHLKRIIITKFYEITNRSRYMQSILFHCYVHSTCFGYFIRPSSGVQFLNCIYSHWYRP